MIVMQRRYLMKPSSGICSKQIRKPGNLTVFTIFAVVKTTKKIHQININSMSLYGACENNCLRCFNK